jgi:hypothetical protein
LRSLLANGGNLGLGVTALDGSRTTGIERRGFSRGVLCRYDLIAALIALKSPSFNVHSMSKVAEFFCFLIDGVRYLYPSGHRFSGFPLCPKL